MYEYAVIRGKKTLEYLVYANRQNESDIKRKLVAKGYTSDIVVKFYKNHGE